MTRDNDMRDNDVTRPFDTLGDIRMTPSEQDEVWGSIARSMQNEAVQPGKSQGTNRKRRGSRGKRHRGAFATGAAAVAAMAIVAAGIGYGIYNHTFTGGTGRATAGSKGTSNVSSAVLPSNPSSITVTKYTTMKSKRADVSTYTLTGSKMLALYRGLQHTVTPSRKVPKNAGFSCPSYASSAQYTAIAWTYEIVVHYPAHSSRSFKQTYDGCLFVIDEQTGATYMPDIKDHTTLGNLPGLTPLTWVKNK